MGDRLAGKTGPEALFEGVPDHLDRLLRNWIYTTLAECNGLVNRVQLRLRLPSAVLIERRGAEQAVAAYRGDANPLIALEIADAVLRFSEERYPNRQMWRVAAQELAAILYESGSAYAVSDDLASIERRVDETVARSAAQAQASASANVESGSAASHLRLAWIAAYGLDPSPTTAYGESIKAVEAAAHHVIEPNNTKATLGTMIGVVRNSPSAFQFAVQGPNSNGTTLLALLQLLWQGQTSRHGGQQPTRNETQAEAEVAVHLAATLVQWFSSGAVTRVP